VTVDLANLDLVPLRDAAHVAAYHDLRRVELFARYSPDITYRSDIADEHAPQNLPHVLLLGREVIGTIRIDLIDRRRAGLRLITVKPGLRNGGIGGWMLARAEAVVWSYGRDSIVINAANPALPFYLRHGYRTGAWADVLEPDLAHNTRVGKLAADQA
jgi:GNAT superfamily N-acetyltransferase